MKAIMANLNPAVQKPRMTGMTRMGTGFVMVESLFRGHPPGEHPFHRNPFFIRVIREIRGSNCCFQDPQHPRECHISPHGKVAATEWQRTESWRNRILFGRLMPHCRL